ncbi:MAG: ferredoxin--NADP(+) reductase [Thaumarchaeota archaeon]|nr:ferredoxin--NADP(+) reductase [Nitrososphaerota archaeon]
MDLYDITIIGAGPSGLFAAFYAGLRGMRTKVIEALPEPGGQLAILYPEKFIYDVPGFPKIMAKDLVSSLWEQANRFNPSFHLAEKVGSLHHINSKVIELDTDKGIHHTKSVLIAAGIGAFSPNKLDIPKAKEFEENGVFYFVKEKADFQGKRILIVGGGDSAVDWALNLRETAKQVILIHRRDVFRSHEESLKQLFQSDIPIGLFYELKEINGSDNVESVKIFNNKRKEEISISTDAVLISIGFRADIGSIKDWGLEIQNRTISVDGSMRTNISGVFAAGDIAFDVDSAKLNLIATGFAQSTIAVNCAKKYIDPKSQMNPGHSSEMKLESGSESDQELVPAVTLDEFLKR